MGAVSTQLFILFVSLLSIFQLPGQPCHPFPDWPSLDPSGLSVIAGPAGNGTVPSLATLLSGGPADFSFAPSLKFFMESVNHLVLTFESNQLSVQHMMKEQQQQFSSHLELLHAKLAQTSPATPPSPFSFHGDVEGGDDLPIPLKKKWTRCHLLKNAWVVDGEVDMMTYNQFLVSLLGIKDLKNIADAKDCCIILEEENEAFMQELLGSIQITANDFRLDLSQDHSMLFNHTAMEIFAADFYQKKVLQGVRKVRLYKWHLDTIARDPHLSRHKHLLEALGTQGMSSDKSDTEAPGHSSRATLQAKDVDYKFGDEFPFCAKEDDLHGHSKSITCLSFLPTGDYLASGGEDSNLIVWDPMKGTLVHRVPGPGQDQDSDVLTGVDAPVDVIAINAYSGVIVLGMGSKVHLAKWVSPSHYATFKILPLPPELPNTLQDTDKHVWV
ncbi:hypothetical protein EDC04DRAFT_2604834 [Pisolithus marmoratus]|nr:hypothetical protein EDC04DRAFT_2604834 [Pisolithus marmoratus]